ncbi:unnamed protein product [Moneuplotes crassus]|uniref:TLDc domain-containing protein n=2 Tax=Euplotes crassus TaxID=5936 RepID=A0AAD1X766_EUPCR|nr:unnamed protein product [Moneuplotes crassus]
MDSTFLGINFLLNSGEKKDQKSAKPTTTECSKSPIRSEDSKLDVDNQFFKIAQETQSCNQEKKRKASMNMEKKMKKMEGYTKSFFKSMQQAKETQKKRDIPKELDKVEIDDWDSNLKEIHKYVENKEDCLRSEGYYCTLHGNVKGMISIKEGIIIFDPLSSEENEEYDDLSRFNCYIDLQDICDVQMIKIPNESAAYVQDENDRQCYIYDYYIQFALSTLNGKTIDKLLSKKIQTKRGSDKLRITGLKIDEETKFTTVTEVDKSPPDSEKKHIIEKSLPDNNVFHKQSKSEPKGLVFFRFSHRGRDKKALTNEQQEAIVDNIYQNIYYLTSNISPSKFSSSKVPFYDSLIDENDKVIPYSNVCSKDKVTKYSENYYKPSNKVDTSIVEEGMSMKTKVVSASIPTFSPFIPGVSSAIISETQAIMISRFLPPMIRMREWERVFSIDVDGASYKTFYKNVYNHSATILIIQDSNGWKFGAYAASDWEIKKHFYGTGESFLFTFKDTDQNISTYKWTGENDNIQHCGETSIAMGGDQGKHALYIRNYFLTGASHKCKTFNNEVISSDEFFDIVKFEVWGFDCY